MWNALRKLPVFGTHFRRQVAIGPYVVDFACLRARLLIEIDGGQHNRDTNHRSDAERTKWLEREGYRVIRYWNNEVLENIDGVLDTINAVLYASPSSESPKSSHPTPALARPFPDAGFYS